MKKFAAAECASASSWRPRPSASPQGPGRGEPHLPGDPDEHAGSIIRACVSPIHGDLFAEAGDLAKGRRLPACQRSRRREVQEHRPVRGHSGASAPHRQQRLRSGDIRQTRQLLERIELIIPSRSCPAAGSACRADRFAGKYEEAIPATRSSSLTRWAGYRQGRARHRRRLRPHERLRQGGIGSPACRNCTRPITKQKLADFRKLLRAGTNGCSRPRGRRRLLRGFRSPSSRERNRLRRARLRHHASRASWGRTSFSNAGPSPPPSTPPTATIRSPTYPERQLLLSSGMWRMRAATSHM